MRKCKNCFFEDRTSFIVDVTRDDVICTRCGAVQDHIQSECVISKRLPCTTTGDITSACEFVTTVSMPNRTTEKVDKRVCKLTKQYGVLLDATDHEMDHTIALIKKHPYVRSMKPIAASVVATLVLLKRENNTMAEFNIRKVEEITNLRLGDRLVRIANEYQRDSIKDPVTMIPMVISRLGLPQRYNKYLKTIYLRKYDYFQKLEKTQRRPNRSTIFAVVVYMFFNANRNKSDFKDKIDIDFIAEITQTTTANIQRFLAEYNGQ